MIYSGIFYWKVSVLEITKDFQHLNAQKVLAELVS